VNTKLPPLLPRNGRVSLPPLRPLSIAELRSDNDTPADVDRLAKHKSTGKDNYNTPPPVVGVVKSFDEIVLDPAGAETHDTVGARRTYLLSRGEDGLALPWANDGLNFNNPPYSERHKWMMKADREWRERRCESILLVAARTDTIAFQACTAVSICFWKGRIIFIDGDTGGPPLDRHGKPTGAVFPSAMLYWGLRVGRFHDVFAPHGRTVLWTLLDRASDLAHGRVGEIDAASPFEPTREAAEGEV